MANYGSFAGGLAGGLTSGFALGRSIRDYRDEQELKDNLKNAPTVSSTEVMAGDSALEESRKGFVPQEGGPQTFDEQVAQNPEAYKALADRKAGFEVKGKLYENKADADLAAAALNRDTRAGIYERHGEVEKADALRARGMQMELTGIQLGDAKREAGLREQRDKIIKDAQGIHARINSKDPDEQFAALQELSSKHNLSGWGGKTFSNISRDDNGQIVIALADPTSGKVIQQPYSPEIGSQILNSYIQHETSNLSASDWDRVRKEKNTEARADRAEGRDERKTVVSELEGGAKVKYYESGARENDAKAGFYRDGGSGGSGNAQIKQDWNEFTSMFSTKDDLDKGRQKALERVERSTTLASPEEKAAAIKKVDDDFDRHEARLGIGMKAFKLNYNAGDAAAIADAVLKGPGVGYQVTADGRAIMPRGTDENGQVKGHDISRFVPDLKRPAEKKGAITPPAAGNAPPQAKPRTSAIPDDGPSYEKWVAAKKELDKVRAAAKRMSPDAAAAYLESREPDLVEAVKRNEKYRTY